MIKRLTTTIYKTRHCIYQIITAWKNRSHAPPIYTKHSVSGLKVHLGAGEINLQGWINVDARPKQHVHLISEGFDLDQFADKAIEEIYMCHVLEHFSFKEAEALLMKLKVKLRNGGVIRISVPNIDRLIDIYMASNRNLDKIKYALMGGQDYQFNYHKSVYNEAVLRGVLEKCGFIHVTTWEAQVDFGVELGDWSTGTFSTEIGPIPVSVNLKGVCRYG